MSQSASSAPKPRTLSGAPAGPARIRCRHRCRRDVLRRAVRPPGRLDATSWRAPLTPRARSGRSVSPTSFEKVNASVTLRVRVKVDSGREDGLPTATSPLPAPARLDGRFFKRFGIPETRTATAPTRSARRGRQFSSARARLSSCSADRYPVTNDHVVDHRAEFGRGYPPTTQGLYREGHRHDSKTDIGV